MLKQQEIDNLESCLNKAAQDEPLFVLRGKDACSAETIRAWTVARIRAGKNQVGDQQILEALAIAENMEEYSARHAREAAADPEATHPRG